jgi:polysaccharide export outer membrane protein
MKFSSSIAVVGMLGVALAVSAQTTGLKPSGTVRDAGASVPGATDTTARQLYPAYVIGPDDSIQITVWKEPALSGTMVVRPDGMISLSLIGDVQASGMTPQRLSESIKTQLQKYISDPNVNVSLVAVNSKRIYFIGEVQHAGPMSITPGMTVLQAISSAGGVTPYANTKRIYILRNIQDRQLKINFDYKKAVKTGDLQGTFLVPGDTIVVP